MNIFDIIGPVMVGPSSSHTAGAVKIGYITSKLLGENPTEAEILLHGSFAATGVGHGTIKAILAGLMGMKPDDERIPESVEIANQSGLKFSVGEISLKNVHPNSVMLKVLGEYQRKLNIVASSTGGGRVVIRKIDGVEANFTGDYPTLIVHNTDKPGYVAAVTSTLSRESVNIATMQLYRSLSDGFAVMVIETDQSISNCVLEQLKELEGIIKVTYLEICDW